MVNYYEILELEDFASIEDIKAAHRRLSKRYHPDLNNGDKQCEERFKEVQHAYEQLREPTIKEIYDDELRYKDEYEQYAAAPEYTPPKSSFGRRRRWAFPVFAAIFFLIKILIQGDIYSRLPDTTHFAAPVNTPTTTVFPAVFEKKPSFTIGAIREQVRDIQGMPSQIIKYKEQEIWSYGNSTVTFKNGIVAGYSNIDGNLHVSY